jgi:NAD(P)-dependent dehydrogenase (short-subunit alcohol dehydrogenase family)|tara:strand:- start:606 stop:1412 length:807 start_codon:yes stop_codon:yes gene_type:complete
MNEKRPRLEGKVAIVTGAGSRGEGVGNGKATATLFAREGASVLLADMEIERANETLQGIESEGGIASTIKVDVTRDGDCLELVDTAIERYGRLDILDNNVGNSFRKSVTEIEPDEWDSYMELNLKSMVLTSRHAIPRMIDTGGGSIINIASIAGVRASKATVYTASKAGVIGLTISMAADHGREGIRVNAIAPGAVYTPMVSWRLSDEMRAHRKNTTALGTEGTPWDVAWAAVYLASDESRWVTGSILTVDGGSSILSRHAYTDSEIS